MRKLWLKLKSVVMSIITGEEIEYLDGKDLPPLMEIRFFNGGEEHW